MEYIRDAPKNNWHSTMLSQIRQLPIFEDINEEMVALQNFRIVVVPKSIPRDGLGAIKNQNAGCIFLKEINFDALAQHLNFNVETVDNMYSKYILPCWNKFDAAVCKIHLTFIKDHYDISGADLSDSMLSSLKSLVLIEDGNGRLKKVFEFYNPRKTLFIHFLSEDKMLPEDWMGFLKLFKKIGLNSEFTKEHFLDFALRLEMQENGHEKAKEDSDLLVKNLFQSWNKGKCLDPSFLKDLKRVKFLCGDDGVSFYPFAKSYEYVLKSYVERVSPYLTSDQDPKQKVTNQKWRNALCSAFEIRAEVSVEVVVKNLKKIAESISDSQIRYRSNITDCLEYLQRQRIQLKPNVLKVLSELPLVVCKERELISRISSSEGGSTKWKTVKAFCVSLSAPDTSTSGSCFPYLVPLPREYEKVTEILFELGATETLDVEQIVKILGTAAEGFQSGASGDSKEYSITPNVKRIMISLLQMAFNLGKEDDLECVKNLESFYFLTNDNKLLLSSDCWFCDEVNYAELCDTKNSFIDAKPFGLDCHYIVDNLQQQIKPKCLSGVLSRSVIPGEAVAAEHPLVAKTEAMLLRLKSKEMRSTVETIVANQLYEDHKTDDYSKKIDKITQSLKLTWVHDLHIEYSSDTELELPSMNVPKKMHLVEGEEAHYYISEVECGEELEQCISDIIAKKLWIDENSTQFFKSSRIFAEVLGAKNSVDIDKILLNYKMKKLEGCIDTIEIGSFVPTNLVIYLTKELTFFKIEDYAALKKSDVSQLFEASYIFVRVVKEVPTDGNKLLRYVVQVNAKGEKEEVDACDLFAFDQDVNKACPSTAETEVDVVQKSVAIGELLEKISTFDLNNETKMKLVVRAADSLASFLAENEETIDEEKKNWLKQTFEQKVQVLNISFQQDEQDDIEAQMMEQLSGLSNYVTTETVRLTKHSTVWNTYSENVVLTRPINARVPNSTAERSSKVPRVPIRSIPMAQMIRSAPADHSQPVEARRWLQQARSDLDAAIATQHIPEETNNWTCFKSHQAAEKALKACCFMENGSNLDAQSSVSNLNFVLHKLSSRTKDLERAVEALSNTVGDSNQMRYPRAHRELPRDSYSADQAQRAIQAAETIVEWSTEFIRNKN